MKPEYILLIACGGVFVFFLFLYFLVAHERRKAAKSLANRIIKAYSDKSLKKMEYDVAFYDGKTYNFLSDQEAERQVTIDDVLNSAGKDERKIAEEAIFSQVEYGGNEEIIGTYNPEQAK